ncbi:hypothetical protein QLG13_07895 [Rhodococcus aetherivorans]|uniref:hypothetical protein n=1 Tax=Rhodococcus aetherivorans TaxID=191292 RepID=UPI003EBC0C5E
MKDRDELARIIMAPRMHTNASGDKQRAIADAILASGYRKPRTITTVEEALALPEGSVIRSSKDGYVFEMTEPSYGRPQGIGPGDDLTTHIDEWYLPATVLWMPEEQP